MQTCIAITPGEPAGIGPDLVVLCAEKLSQIQPGVRYVYFCDPQLLQDRIELHQLDLQIQRVESLQALPPAEASTLLVKPVALKVSAQPGQLEPQNAHYVLECIRQAVQSQLDGHSQALMTGPIHKGLINQAGVEFSGHTEFLAELTGGTPVMMLAAEAQGLRVALATTHLPLSRVSQAISRDSLQQVLGILHRDLQQKYAIQAPRILVCGLNPHAGEGGHLGHEEIEIIEPVLQQLRQQGLNLTGPLPADTLFTPKYLEQADAVLAMYHDQGLPVLKHVGFGHAINITLGLAINRTSVDHGTALELAGCKQLDSGSYMAAIESAIGLAQNSLSAQQAELAAV